MLKFFQCIFSFFKFIFLFLMIPFLILSTIFINPKKEYEKNSKFYRFLLNNYTWFALTVLRVKVHAEGMDKVPENTRFLLVQNHYSNFDPIVTWYVFKKNTMAFVSKPENFKVPFFGRMIRKCCFLPIDRENPRNAVKTVDKAANLIKADEVCVGIYPEGTRNKSYVGLLPFHNSVFKIAHKANNAPIVIVGVSGTEKIHKNTPWKKTHVYIEVMQVLSSEDVQAMRTNEIGKTTEERLLAFLEKHGHTPIAGENTAENPENIVTDSANGDDSSVSA